MDDRIQVIRTKLTSIKSTLEKASEQRKKDHVSYHTGEDYNAILEAIAAEYPKLNGLLPPKMISSPPYIRARQMNVTYLDLEIFCEQLLNLLALQD